MSFSTKISQCVKKFPSVLKRNSTTSPITRKNAAEPSLSLKKTISKDTVDLSNKASDIILDVQKFAEESPYLSNYLRFYDDYKYAASNSELFGINLIKVLEKEPHRAKEFEQIAKQITERMQQLQYVKESFPYAVKSFLDLYYHNSEAFRHVVKSEKLIDLFYLNGYQINKNISLNIIKEIEKSSSDPILGYYVQNSDNIYKSPEAIRQLSEFLSKNTTESALSVTRAVKHAGAFNHVELPKTLERQIKLINKILKPFTQKSGFSEYTHSYIMSDSKTTNLYDYINSKENLSLADAMQMMRFLPKPLQNKVIEMIKQTKIVDNRFKSTTFNPSFVEKWLGSCDFQTTIQHNINIPKGTQGCYVTGSATNPQHEFVINNVPKEFNFTDVIYDSKKNRFILSSDMRIL